MRPAGWQQRNWSTGLFATFNCNYTTVKTINKSSFYPFNSPSLSLRKLHSSCSLSCFLTHSSFSQPPSPYISQKGAIYRRRWGYVLYGGQGRECSSSNVLLEKDDLLWLRVPDWSYGVTFIHLHPPAAAAAAFTSNFLLVPSPLFPFCPGLSCNPAAGSWPLVAAVIGSIGVEKEAAAPSFPLLPQIEGKGEVIKNWSTVLLRSFHSVCATVIRQPLTEIPI